MGNEAEKNLVVTQFTLRLTVVGIKYMDKNSSL